MTTHDTFVAIFLGSKSSAKMTAWTRPRAGTTRKGAGGHRRVEASVKTSAGPSMGGPSERRRKFPRAESKTSATRFEH